MVASRQHQELERRLTTQGSCIACLNQRITCSLDEPGCMRCVRDNLICKYDNSKWVNSFTTSKDLSGAKTPVCPRKAPVKTTGVRPRTASRAPSVPPRDLSAPKSTQQSTENAHKGEPSLLVTGIKEPNKPSLKISGGMLDNISSKEGVLNKSDSSPDCVAVRTTTSNIDPRPSVGADSHQLASSMPENNSRQERELNNPRHTASHRLLHTTASNTVATASADSHQSVTSMPDNSSPQKRKLSEPDYSANHFAARAKARKVNARPIDVGFHQLNTPLPDNIQLFPDKLFRGSSYRNCPWNCPSRFRRNSLGQIGCYPWGELDLSSSSDRLRFPNSSESSTQQNSSFKDISLALSNPEGLTCPHIWTSYLAQLQFPISESSSLENSSSPEASMHPNAIPFGRRTFPNPLMMGLQPFPDFSERSRHNSSPLDSAMFPDSSHGFNHENPPSLDSTTSSMSSNTSSMSFDTATSQIPSVMVPPTFPNSSEGSNFPNLSYADPSTYSSPADRASHWDLSFMDASPFPNSSEGLNYWNSSPLDSSIFPSSSDGSAEQSSSFIDPSPFENPFAESSYADPSILEPVAWNQSSSFSFADPYGTLNNEQNVTSSYDYDRYPSGVRRAQSVEPEEDGPFAEWPISPVLVPTFMGHQPFEQQFLDQQSLDQQLLEPPAAGKNINGKRFRPSY